MSLFAVVLLLSPFVACTDSQQRQVQTEVAKAGQTSIAAAKTQAVPLQTEAVKAGQTVIANAQQTAAAAAATQIAGIGKYQRKFPNSAGNDKYLIGAYFYTWYGSGRNKWETGYALEPALGEYDSSDANVINQQIDWATGHGIDFFAVSYWGPDSRENTILRNDFLNSQLINDIRFAILYESTGRLTQSADGTINLSDPKNRQILFDDFAYFQANYWGHSQYLKIGGRPVVILYLSRLFSGDVAGAISNLRQASKNAGYDIYLIGDEVYWRTWQPLEGNRLKLFDAVTAYNMHASVDSIANNFTNKVRDEYSVWRAQALKMGTSFVPGVIPGFHDTFVRPQEQHPPIPRSTNFFDSQLDMALKLTDPQVHMVLITSWNEWLEDTSIEPAKSFQFEYLDILQSKLAR